MKRRMTVNQYTGHIALILSCMFVGIVSNQATIHVELIRGITHSLLQATLLYALLRLCASIYLIRYSIVLLIVITFFVQLSYHSTLTTNIIVNIINASNHDIINFSQHHVIEILITSGITLILALAPFPKSTLITYSVSAIGFSYLLVPLLLQLPHVYQNSAYQDYLDKGGSRSYSNSFYTIEYTLYKLSPRLPLFSTLIAISDTINLYYIQTKTTLSLAPTYPNNTSLPLCTIDMLPYHSQSITAKTVDLFTFKYTTLSIINR